MINHRRDLRIKTDLEAVGNIDGVKTSLKIANISRSGACIKLKGHLTASQIDLSFALPFLEKEVEMTAEKRWQKNTESTTTLGMEFINISFKEKMELGYFIDSSLCCTY